MDEKLRMESLNKTQDNISKIRVLFPNAVTEVLRDGKLEYAIDFDILKQELSSSVINDKEERYQFTWPDKKRSILLANTPVKATLRPCKEESVNFDTTQNLYIEGDNLEVLKLLRETYLSKIKMIYIDPPYNTGNDFIYEDDFAVSQEEYDKCSGNYDDVGNRMTQNTETNGRFHTDWLNMMYPRLKVAKDLLSNDGVIFISIDDHELDDLKKICNEIFGEANYIATLVRKTKTTSNNGNQFAPSHEYIIVCAKSISSVNVFNDPEAQEDEEYIKLFKYEDSYSKYNIIGLYQPALKHGGSTYPIECPDGTFVITPDNKPWRWNEQTFLKNKAENRVVFKQTNTSPLLRLDGTKADWNIYTKIYLKDRLDSGMRPITFIDKYTNSEASKELLKMGIPFDFSKPRKLIQYLIKICGADDNSIIMDFFAGSSSTAHAVMQLNAEDGGHRKFIMVQLPEICDTKSDAYKAGFSNICEIGEERIRKAGTMIIEEGGLTVRNSDIGFRVLKLDSSNMKDVFYKPAIYTQSMLDAFESNIKDERQPLDLLFQVMLETNKMLSAKIEEREIAGKKVFVVDDSDLVCCFDDGVTDEVVSEIAKLHPLYAVFRDRSFDTDSVQVNFDQIFAAFSPNTIRKVL